MVSIDLNKLEGEIYIDYIRDYMALLEDGKFDHIELFQYEMIGLIGEENAKNVINKANELISNGQSKLPELKKTGKRFSHPFDPESMELVAGQDHEWWIYDNKLDSWYPTEYKINEIEEKELISKLKTEDLSGDWIRDADIPFDI